MTGTIVPEEPPPPPSADFARPAAYGAFNTVAVMYKNLGGQIRLSQTTANSYTDEFWEVSGYEKSAVIAALDQLENMIGQFQSSADVLGNQAPA